MPEIKNILVLSTSHIPEYLSKKWEAEKHPSASKTEQGYFCWAYPDYAPDEEVEPELKKVCGYARKQGAEYVLFDCGADTVDGLPTWEW